MEDLFTTNIAVNNQNVMYRVVFDNDKYNFISEASNGEFPVFSFKRDGDEWKDQDLVAPEIKKQAIDALERYLLKQH